jgi:hypothetical protein
VTVDWVNHHTGITCIRTGNGGSYLKHLKDMRLSVNVRKLKKGDSFSMTVDENDEWAFL